MSDHPQVTVKSKEPVYTDTTPKKRGRPKKKKDKSPEPESKSGQVILPSGISSEQIQLPELEEWDPTGLPNGFFMVLEGKRRTGKSTFVKWLLQYYQDKFSLVWVMSQTAISGYWQKFVGTDFVFDHYDRAAIAMLFQRNNEIIKKYGEESPIALETGHALIIFDDCINKDIWQDEIFIKMAVEGRHHLISVIFITQDPKTICPKIRDNSDVCVVFNQKTFRNKESIWGDFMNDVDKKTAWAMLSHWAVEHDALVCVQTNLNSKIERNFYVSTGDKTKLEDPDYMLGGETQKALIKRERQEKKERDKMKKIEEKGDHRPNKDKVDEELKAQEFTVDKIFKQT
jgi:hypothetical protein